MAHPLLRSTIIPILARRIKIVGLDHVPFNGPYLVVANHQSYLDGVQLAFIILLKRNHKVWFLTTEHVWKVFSKFGGGAMLRWLGMIPIYESHKGDSLKAAIDTLRAGGVIGIFPEGMRNKPVVNPSWEKVMLKGKTGAARLALSTGVPVIPTGIRAPRGFTTWEAIRGFFSRREPARVIFGRQLKFEHVEPENITKELLDDVTRRIMLEVGRLCNKEYPY